MRWNSRAGMRTLHEYCVSGICICSTSISIKLRSEIEREREREREGLIMN
jgi:hypothetical protein